MNVRSSLHDKYHKNKVDISVNLMPMKMNMNININNNNLITVNRHIYKFCLNKYYPEISIAERSFETQQLSPTSDILNFEDARDSRFVVISKRNTIEIIDYSIVDETNWPITFRQLPYIGRSLTEEQIEKIGYLEFDVGDLVDNVFNVEKRFGNDYTNERLRQTIIRCLTVFNSSVDIAFRIAKIIFDEFIWKKVFPKRVIVSDIHGDFIKLFTCYFIQAFYITPDATYYINNFDNESLKLFFNVSHLKRELIINGDLLITPRFDDRPIPEDKKDEYLKYLISDVIMFVVMDRCLLMKNTKFIVHYDEYYIEHKRYDFKNSKLRLLYGNHDLFGFSHTYEDTSQPGYANYNFDLRTLCDKALYGELGSLYTYAGRRQYTNAPYLVIHADTPPDKPADFEYRDKPYIFEYSFLDLGIINPAANFNLYFVHGLLPPYWYNDRTIRLNRTHVDGNIYVFRKLSRAIAFISDADAQGKMHGNPSIVSNMFVMSKSDTDDESLDALHNKFSGQVNVDRAYPVNVDPNVVQNQDGTRMENVYLPKLDDIKRGIMKTFGNNGKQTLIFLGHSFEYANLAANIRDTRQKRIPMFTEPNAIDQAELDDDEAVDENVDYFKYVIPTDTERSGEMKKLIGGKLNLGKVLIVILIVVTVIVIIINLFEIRDYEMREIMEVR